jgi:hypothetical protein
LTTGFLAGIAQRGLKFSQVGSRTLNYTFLVLLFCSLSESEDMLLPHLQLLSLVRRVVM